MHLWLSWSAINYWTELRTESNKCQARLPQNARHFTTVQKENDVWQYSAQAVERQFAPLCTSGWLVGCVTAAKLTCEMASVALSVCMCEGVSALNASAHNLMTYWTLRTFTVRLCSDDKRKVDTKLKQKEHSKKGLK